MTNQKQIVISLDAAANRSAWGASSKQTWFLARLMAQAGDEAKDIDCCISQSNATLSKKQASIWISDYLAQA